MFERIYFDHSATTPVDPRVIEAMMPFLTEHFGNASSIHFYGQKARAAVDNARHQVAALINSRPNEIVFTSGGTESNNLAIRGYFEANFLNGNHIVASSIEHPSVRSVVEDLEKRGVEVTWLPTYEDGVVRAEDVERAVRDNTVLVTLMTANNEVGTIQPVEEVGSIVQKLRVGGQKIRFHTDAVQAAGKIALNVESIGCDLLTLSAHKINAPKGVGALYVRRGTRLKSQNIGGRQERGFRGGTESVASIVAFGKASVIADNEREENAVHIARLRDDFEAGVGELISDVVFNGRRDHRISGISNISFRNVEGEGLLINLDMQGIAVSTGSACSSGSLEPSPVIRALSRDDGLARGAVRFSFGQSNSVADVDRLLAVLPTCVENLRRISPAFAASRLASSER